MGLGGWGVLRKSYPGGIATSVQRSFQLPQGLLQIAPWHKDGLDIRICVGCKILDAVYLCI